jgi:hypothetical protein
MPQMSIGNGGSSPSVQYGISSLPVSHRPQFLIVFVERMEAAVARWLSCIGSVWY